MSGSVDRHLLSDYISTQTWRRDWDGQVLGLSLNESDSITEGQEPPSGT